MSVESLLCGFSFSFSSSSRSTSAIQQLRVFSPVAGTVTQTTWFLPNTNQDILLLCLDQQCGIWSVLEEVIKKLEEHNTSTVPEAGVKMTPLHHLHHYLQFKGFGI